MSRLTKREAKLHDEAEAILAKDALSDEEKDFVIAHWQESATSVNTTAGAFFTPLGMAETFTVEVGAVRSCIDLCAGMGTLSLAIWRAHQHRQSWEGTPTPRLVCAELNPEYVRVGRKLLPEAEWVNASIFDLPDNLGHFDVAVSNPPFGKLKRDGDSPTYAGGEFEYHVISIASQLADYGVFIIPNMSLGWQYSGEHTLYQERASAKHTRFVKQTGINLTAGCGIDCHTWIEEWHGVAPQVEVACADFTDSDVKRATPPAETDALFEAAS